MEELMFSVAVLTYNQEKWVSQALDSIISQEHDYKYEVIVGDDFSTDGTRAIIQKYATEYPDIVKPILNEKNIGLIKNYFNVIDHCKGKYIMGVAGDDYWLPGKVSTQIEFMESHPDVDMCYGKARVWDEEKSIYIDIDSPAKQVTFFDLCNECSIAALTVCLRRETILKYIADINPVEQCWCMEDYPMWLWFFSHGKCIFLDNFVAVYRLLGESVSHSHDIEKQIKFINSTYEVKKFFAGDELFHSKFELKYLDEIGNIFWIHDDKKNYLKIYRKIQKKIGTKKSWLKYYLSFFIGYYQLLKFKNSK